MKNFFSSIIEKAKNFVANLTPATKLRYIIISVITVAVAVSLLIVVPLNTSDPETPTNPDDFATGETASIDFDNEIIFEIGGESSSVATTDVVTENPSITTNEVNDTEEPTSAEESTNVQTETNTEPIDEPDPQPTDPSQDYNHDPQPEDTTNTSVINTDPTETTSQTQTQTQTTPKPTETTKAPQTEPKPTETTKAPQTQPKPTETTTTVPQTTAKPTETTKPQETEPQPAGQFSLKEKKYDYNGANVTILQVENKSQQAYTITITGKFKDANGNIVKTESKTFEGFPAEWSNYFVFQPGVKYSSASWGMDIVEFDGKTYAQGIDFGSFAKSDLTQLYADNSGKTYLYAETPDCRLETCVIARLFFKYVPYDGNRTLGVKTEYVVFDKDGKMIMISVPDYQGRIEPNSGNIDTGAAIPLWGTGYLWEDRNEYVMPENLKSITVIKSVISVAEE